MAIRRGIDEQFADIDLLDTDISETNLDALDAKLDSDEAQQSPTGRTGEEPKAGLGIGKATSIALVGGAIIAPLFGLALGGAQMLMGMKKKQELLDTAIQQENAMRDQFNVRVKLIDDIEKKVVTPEDKAWVEIQRRKLDAADLAKNNRSTQDLATKYLSEIDRDAVDFSKLQDEQAIQAKIAKKAEFRVLEEDLRQTAIDELAFNKQYRA